MRPSFDAEHVNHARCAFGSNVVSYQHAQSTPVCGSTAAAGKNCCVLPLSGGGTVVANFGPAITTSCVRLTPASS